MFEQKKPLLFTRKATEIIIIVILSFILCLSILSDLLPIDLPDTILIKATDPEALLLQLFSIQATVATVSIAIVSIISGFSNESFLGLSVSAFVSNIKPTFFKHKTLIIIGLILIVLNYVCVSMLMYNTSIALFAITMFIAIWLVKDVYALFTGKRKVESEIRAYILKNYDISYLNNLNQDILVATETNNSIELNQNLAILNDIFEAEVIKRQYVPSEITSQISSILADTFEKVIAQHNSTKTNNMMLVVCKFYEIANKNCSSPLELALWDRISEDFFCGLKDLTLEQLTNDLVHIRMRKLLYANLNGQSAAILRYYTAYVYTILQNKTPLGDTNRLKKSLYSSVYSDVFYDENTCAINELCFLHKVMIDSGESNILKTEFFDYCAIRQNNLNHGLVYLVTLVYLYYLSSREKLVAGTELQSNAQKILEENQDTISDFYYYIDLQTIVKEHRGFIYDCLNRWEYMEERQAKLLIADSVVDDFLIFSAAEKYWNITDLSNAIDCIVTGSMFPLYSRYFHEKNYPAFQELFLSYQKVFSSRGNDNEKIVVVRDVFNRRYKEEILEEGAKSVITKETMNWFSKNLQSFIKEITEKNFHMFSFMPSALRQDAPHDTETEITEKKDIEIALFNLPCRFIQAQDIDPYIKSFCYSSVVHAFLQMIYTGISVDTFSPKDKEKQKKIIESLKSNGISANVAIGERNTFWGEEDESLLSKFTEGMTRIPFPNGYNYYFLIDSNLVNFSFDNIRVEFQEISDDEIAQRSRKNADGSTSFNAVNDIFIPFEESEIKQHIHNTEKAVAIIADIKYRLAAEKVGVGMKIAAL